ncbi:MAG: L-threonylcarbamoyladenylate synthase [Bacillota bacterium]|nr:L-threonylcarbamoyladenylate synthase [Bacillota bacterium]
MKTRVVRVDPVHPAPGALREAGEVLRGGGLVAFPTETVYGLGADALNPAAVRRIFAAKGRPGDNPLIIHVADRESLAGLVKEVPEAARALMDRFWPGPLTLVLPKAELVPDEVTAGLATVAVRMPNHRVALGLIAAAGVPVAAPSANRSGRPSPTTAAHVWEDLGGRVEFILDAGPTGVGVESTVVDLTGPRPVVLRPGGLALEDLRQVAGEVTVDPALLGREVDRPRSPGLKYTHYAPKAPLTLIEPGPGVAPQVVGEAAWRAVREVLAASPHKPVGLLFLRENLPRHREAASATATAFLLAELNQDAGAPPATVLALEAGPATDPAQVASRLFAALRWFDAAGVAAIVAEGISPEGLGFAVMNRLRKAAGAVVRV